MGCVGAAGAQPLSSPGIAIAIFGPEATDAQRRSVRSLVRFAVDEGWIEGDPVEADGRREFERIVPVGDGGANGDLLSRFIGRARGRLVELDWPTDALDRFEERVTIVVA
jgi:hypothetical protein